MYLTASRPDIMFAVSACSRHQVTPTTSNLEAVKKIFKYLKGQPKLGLWYPKESPLVLEAYSDSDYAGANKDRKSTTGGCQFLGTLDTKSVVRLWYQFFILITNQLKHSILLLQSSMAALQYKAEHNKVGYLFKPTESDDYHNIIDFLRSSHIRYALTSNPIIFDSLVKQFWSTATLRAHELGPPAIRATIDRTPYTITGDLVRIRLQLADDGGVAELPISKIYSGMDNLGYDQFGSPIAIALICLFDGRFLQTILGIETRVTRQYKVLVFSSKLFANMRLNFAGNPMPLLPAMLLQAQAGEGAKVDAQDVPHPVPAPIQYPSHLPNPHRPQSSDPVPLVPEHDHSFDQHETAAGSFPTREDAPLGGDFYTSPTRLCDPTAFPPGASGVPHGASDVSPGASVTFTAALAVPADSPKVLTAVPANSLNVPAGVSRKGKYPMVEEDILVKSRTFRQMEEDRLCEEAAKQLHDEEMAHMERESAEAHRKRQQEVLESAILLGDDVSVDNFPPRMAALIKQKRQALAEQLFKERQNRPLTLAQQNAYMRQYVKNHSSAIYNTGWTIAYVISFSDEQLKQEFEKIHKVQSHS
nr:putative ribonuclease H-like domain-containing protein [Tanacetum cinerariifolium]